MAQSEWMILAPILCLLMWELVSVRRAIRQAGDKPAPTEAAVLAEPARRWGAGLRDTGLRDTGLRDGAGDRR